MNNEEILNVYVDKFSGGDATKVALTIEDISKALGKKRVPVSLRRQVNEMVKKDLLDCAEGKYSMTDTGVDLLLGGEHVEDTPKEDTPVDTPTDDDDVFGDDTSDPDDTMEDAEIAEEISEPEVVAVKAELVDDDGEVYSPEASEYPMIARSMWESEGLSLSGIMETDIVVRKESIREAAQTAKTMNDRLGLVQGELLYEIKAGEYWREWEFASFEEYVESELGYKSRKATYMIDIYAKFVLELGLPMERLQALEWSKAKEVLTVIDKDNSEEVLGVLEASTFKEVQAYARKKKGKPSGDKPGFTRMVFNLTDDQAGMVLIALASARKMLGSEENGRALVAMSEEYVATYGDGEA